MPLVVKFADTQKEKEAKKTQVPTNCTVTGGVTTPIVSPTNGSFNNAAAYLQV
jgi:hypothetical protein